MTEKTLSGDCLSCESTYSIHFMEEMVSQELPEHCPFCGEVIDQLTYIEEDEEELDDEDKWD